MSVVHNTVQNSFVYPADNHHWKDDVHWTEREQLEVGTNIRRKTIPDKVHRARKRFGIADRSKLFIALRWIGLPFGGRRMSCREERFPGASCGNHQMAYIEIICNSVSVTATTTSPWTNVSYSNQSTRHSRTGEYTHCKAIIYSPVTSAYEVVFLLGSLVICPLAELFISSCCVDPIILSSNSLMPVLLSVP